MNCSGNSVTAAEKFGPELIINGNMEEGNPPVGWNVGGRVGMGADSGGAILSAGRTFSQHIESLQSRPGDTGKVWEHMIWLVGETRKVAAKITEK